MTQNTLKEIARLLPLVREKSPIVHHITNYVTVNDCANVTLAIGASPIMADAVEEAADIASIAGGVVINIGTLNERTIKSMLIASKTANEKGIPVLLDPVGAGASRLRNDTTAMLLKEVKFDIVRGNMSEIRFIAGLEASTKGVDASTSDMKNSLESGIETARSLAQKLGSVVAVTGATDIISDGNRTLLIKNGHPMMGGITGTGCMCSSLIGSFCGVSKDMLLAATAGILCMGIAGDIAFEQVGKQGLGSYHMAIIDALSRISISEIENMAKISRIN